MYYLLVKIVSNNGIIINFKNIQNRRAERAGTRVLLIQTPQYMVLISRYHTGSRRLALECLFTSHHETDGAIASKVVMSKVITKPSRHLVEVKIREN